MTLVVLQNRDLVSGSDDETILFLNVKKIISLELMEHLNAKQFQRIRKIAYNQRILKK